MSCKSFAVAFILPLFKKRKKWARYLVCSSLVYLMFFVAYTSWFTPSSYRFNYGPIGFDVSRTSAAPHVVHVTIISTAPLTSIAVATIDSIARHMPSLTINLHVTQEEDIPKRILNQRVSVLNRQLEGFRSKGVKVNLILHGNVEADVAGTPLENLRLRQRHVAGLYGVQPHRYFYGHASDVMRFLLLLKHGGIFSDYDNIAVADILPLFNYYGPNILSSDPNNVTLDEDCTLNDVISGWFALAAGHPLTAATLEYIATVINRDGADRVLPWKNQDSPSLNEFKFWILTGPTAISTAHRALCKGPPPVLLVSEIPSFLKPGNVQGVNDSGLLQATHPDNYGNNNITAPYVVVSRKYLMPLHWNVLEFDRLIDIDASAFGSVEKLHTLAQVIKKIDDSFQVHIFRAKKEWLEFLEKGDRYPLIRYVHAKSCKHLCDLKEFRRVVDLGKTIRAS